MASNLRVDTILPSTGTTLGIGTASGTINFLGNSNLTTTGDVTVGGNLGVGGTLTYEDVTNIDSVGVITARSGIKVSAATSSLLIGSAHASGQRNSVEIHSSPNDGLTISRDGGGSDTDLVLLKNTSNSGTIEVRNSSNAQKIFFDSSGSSHLSGGNLGINNSIPQKRVHISTTGNQKIVIDPNYANNSGGSSNSEANANNIVESLLIRTSYGDNAGSSANAGHKWGIKLQGYNGNDFTQTSGKSAGVYAVSEDTGAGYNRSVGLTFHSSPFDTAHREVMRLTSEGYVTKPYNVLFHAEGGPNTVSNATIVFSNEIYDVGGGYNNSTGKFTPPIAGFYAFYFQVYRNDDQNDANASFIYTPSGGSEQQHSEARLRSAGAAGYSVLNSHMIHYMNLNDTMHVKAGTPTIHCNSVLSYFEGYLLG